MAHVLQRLPVSRRGAGGHVEARRQLLLQQLDVAQGGACVVARQAAQAAGDCTVAVNVHLRWEMWAAEERIMCGLWQQPECTRGQ